MPNYNIVTDEEIFGEFIDWLPELADGECYYVSLFARKKYHESAKNDKSQCKRFSARDKSWLVKKIRQLEIPRGRYTNKDGSSVHQDALALYVSVNPRSYDLAQRNLLVKLAQNIAGQHTTTDPATLAMSQLQKAKSRTCYVDFDFDTERLFEEMSGYIYNHVNYDAITILNTRGGFHVLVDPAKVSSVFKNTWYKGLAGMKDCDVSGDNLIPFAGCVQGGFIPHLIQESPAP